MMKTKRIATMGEDQFQKEPENDYKLMQQICRSTIDQ